MSTLTISIENFLKEDLKKKAKADGVTLTFIVNQALKAYQKGLLEFSLFPTTEKSVTQESFKEVTKNELSEASYNTIKESRKKDISEFVSL